MRAWLARSGIVVGLVLACATGFAQSEPEDTDGSVLEEAYLAYEEGDNDKALPLFERYLEEVPDAHRIRAIVGRILLEEEQPEQATEELTRAIEGLHQSSELTTLGDDLLELEQPELARRAFDRSVERGGGPAALLGLGRAQLDLGEIDPARASFARARQQAPHLAEQLDRLIDRAELLSAAERGDIGTIREVAERAVDPDLRLLAPTLARRAYLSKATRFHFATGAVVDTNAVALIDEPVSPNDIPREGSFGWMVEAELRQRLFKAGGQQLDLVGGGGLTTYLEEEVPDIAHLGVGLSWQPAISPVPEGLEPWQYAISYDATWTFAEYDFLVFSQEVAAALLANWSQAHRTRLRGDASLDLFNGEPDRSERDRDGVSIGAELGHTFLLRELWDLRITPSMYGRSDFREGSDFDMEAIGVRLQLAGSLPLDLEWQLGLHYRREFYTHENSRLLLKDERDDHLYEARVGLSRRFFDDRLSLSVDYTLSDRRSNVSEFDYTRSRIGFSIGIDL